jgi:hypothetical protein
MGALYDIHAFANGGDIHEQQRRESREYFRAACSRLERALPALVDAARDTAGELGSDTFYSDAGDSITLLRRAAAQLEEARRLVARAEAQLPPVVR